MSGPSGGLSVTVPYAPIAAAQSRSVHGLHLKAANCFSLDSRTCAAKGARRDLADRHQNE
jgi:hypothetical protein